MTEKKLHCYHCNSVFNYTSSHSGFGDEIYYYCNKCGFVATVDIYNEKMSAGKFYEKHDLIKSYNPHNKQELRLFEKNFNDMKIEISDNLAACSCGGKFTIDAIPRCPICKKELEWNKIVDELDKNSDSANRHYFKENLKKGWHDIYYFIFNARQVRNNWKE